MVFSTEHSLILLDMKERVTPKADKYSTKYITILYTAYYMNINFDKVKMDEVNKKLCISNDLAIERNKNIIFVYCPPKVGSTSLVSSMRIYASDVYTILHIHDEHALKVITCINDVKVNDIIKYNKSLGKNVYVIDIYRNPIEQKISDFFEGLCVYHFNNNVDNVAKYNIHKIIDRFNRLFPHLSTSDHFQDCYQLPSINPFDHVNKYLLQVHDGITYIKLRLKDSQQWSSILSTIFKKKIVVVRDYETKDKPTSSIYKNFKDTYRIPENLLDVIQNCPRLAFYYTSEEKTKYLNEWQTKSSNEPINMYTNEEYKIYESISKENQYMTSANTHHYLDDGCICEWCTLKRKKNIERINDGGLPDKNYHEEPNINQILSKRREIKPSPPMSKSRTIINRVFNLKSLI